ncbi:MAG TPA: S41 family peptidase [Balneolaceae bacterium]
MKRLNYMLAALVITISIVGCGGDSPVKPPTEIDEASAKKQFVWNAMNYWYYWQGDVPELSKEHFADEQAFQDYLKGFEDAEALFNALLYEQEDDFSFFIENYEEFGKSQRGISKSFGFQFGLVLFSESSNEIFGYVQYVLPDSPADQAGLVRGDVFTGVNGVQLTTENYRDLLLNETSYELTMAEIQNNTISETGEIVSVQAVTLTENPVYLSKVLEVGSTKIGYLIYNAFHRNSHQDLNDVFGTFLSAGIDELVIDLRYNGGGAGITSRTLGGMISGLDSTNTFATYSYNSKRAPAYNRSVSILDEVPVFENGEQVSEVAMNQLAVSRVYVLTGFGTASASELLINGLEPYMDVILIGDQTVGKDEGSYTLYDAPAPYFNKEKANPDHKIAIQPIALKLVNKNGQDYPNGFIPNYEVIEISYLENGLPPLGDPSEPLLAKAIEVITGEPVAKAKKAALSADSFYGKMLIDSNDLKPYGKQLYLQPPRPEK